MIEGLFRALNNPHSAGVEFSCPTFAAAKRVFDEIVLADPDLGRSFHFRIGAKPYTAWAVKKEPLHARVDQEDPDA